MSSNPFNNSIPRDPRITFRLRYNDRLIVSQLVHSSYDEIVLKWWNRSTRINSKICTLDCVRARAYDYRGEAPVPSVEFDSPVSAIRPYSVNIPRARVRKVYTRGGCPWHVHMTLFRGVTVLMKQYTEYVNGRRVVTILPANSHPPRITLKHK